MSVKKQSEKKRLGKKHRKPSPQGKPAGRRTSAKRGLKPIAGPNPDGRRAEAKRTQEADKQRDSRSRDGSGRKPDGGKSKPAGKAATRKATTARVAANKQARKLAEKPVDTRTTGEQSKKGKAKAAPKTAADAPADFQPRTRGKREPDFDEWELAEAARLTTDISTVPNADLPLIAICGRPNVGKSTLFNRLTGSRRSIVGDEPGITRDRIYGEVEWLNERSRLVDTGGIVPDDEALIPAAIFEQARVALDEADAIIMVVDGRTELAAPDLELARLLQRGGKKIFLAVNKMDTEAMNAAAENFRRMGFRNVQPISAEHGIGIGDLMDQVFAVLPPPRTHEAEAVTAQPELADGVEAEEDATLDEAVDEPDSGDASSAPSPRPQQPRKLRTHGEYEQRETKVAIIGRPNVGKSTLLNALTGTARAIVSPIAGTTRDAVDEVVEHDGHTFRFVDTAGIRRKGKTKLMAEKLSVIMARKHLEAADVSLLVIDALEGVTGIDANIGGYAHESGRSVIIVINKWDLVTTARADGSNPDGKPPADRKIFEQQVRDVLKYLDYAPMVFISAVEGKNVEMVFQKVQLVARERRKRVSTGQMNRFLEKVDFQRASVPMSKRVRIYYMTQAAVAPPTFVLFTDKDVKMHFSFERFLANQIREHFGFIGSPIWFKIRARNKKKLAS